MDGRAASAAGDKENQNDVSRHQTPSRRRVKLGTPANYYFKYMNSSSKKNHNGELNTSIMSNAGNDDGDTGTISIPGINLGGGENNTETSFLSMAAESSSGSEASDLLNKSTLSDTTELTASNFVLVTTSKQQLARSTYETLKTERERKAERALEILEREAAEIAKQNMSDSKEYEDMRDLTEERFGNAGHATMGSIPDNPTALGSVSDSSGVGRADISESKGMVGIRDSSPSLRSRISSSPASLRKFHETPVY
jgi:hypothetical protein